MIYVTQGHELGIGLEIFLKSYLLLNVEDQKKITLVTSIEDLSQNLKDLKLNPSLFKNLNFIENRKFSPYSSTNSLLTTLNMITPDDVLITQPTSKDQLVIDSKVCAGYTELFRTLFADPHIAMSFKGYEFDLLLITDHLPLAQITSTINSGLIYDKVKKTLLTYKKFFYSFDEVIFSGINPHAGEKGILGQEESEIVNAIKELEKDFKTKFIGPLSGDTLHHYVDKNKKQLFVYMHHDQALSFFKATQGHMGANLTCGLPFLRLSVDHGTAFDLYGKNKASLSGMIYVLNLALGVNTNVDQ